MTSDPFQIKVWAQMFFDDGSVTEGRRVPASILDDDMGEIRQLAHSLLLSVGRTDGLLLIWGAGCMFYRQYILEEPSIKPVNGLSSNLSSKPDLSSESDS